MRMVVVIVQVKNVHQRLKSPGKLGHYMYTGRCFYKGYYSIVRVTFIAHCIRIVLGINIVYARIYEGNTML